MDHEERNKVRARRDELWAEASRRMDIADEFRKAADAHEKEALRIRDEGTVMGTLLRIRDVRESNDVDAS